MKKLLNIICRRIINIPDRHRVLLWFEFHSHITAGKIRSDLLKRVCNCHLTWTETRKILEKLKNEDHYLEFTEIADDNDGNEFRIIPFGEDKIDKINTRNTQRFQGTWIMISIIALVINFVADSCQTTTHTTVIRSTTIERPLKSTKSPETEKVEYQQPSEVVDTLEVQSN